MGITDKQKSILMKNGWTEPQIMATAYEELSSAIGEILAEKPKSQYHKEVRSPSAVQTEFKPKFDNVSYYVAYAKDLCIAMLAAHIERLKLHPEIEPIQIGALMTEAIFEIKKAKMTFEANK